MRVLLSLIALSSLARAESAAEREMALAADALSRLEIKQAMAHFSTARELAPGKPGPVLGLALSNAALGRCKEASALAEQYLRLNPPSPRPEALELLANCRAAAAPPPPPPPVAIPPPRAIQPSPPRQPESSARTEARRQVAVTLTYWCNAERAQACRELGALYDEGDGVAVDKKRAATLYQLACGLGDAGGCTNLGEMLLNGEGVPPDLARAFELHTRACRANDPTGCFNLALYCEKQLHDRAQAITHYRHACRLGDDDACTWLEEEGEEEKRR